MNGILLAAEIVSGAALVAGQLYDVLTTYQGVFVQKTEKELGSSLSKLLAKNKFVLLTVKPAVAIAAAIGLNYAANTVHTGQAIDAVVSHGVVLAVSVVGAVWGYTVGRSNAAANAADLKAKAAAKVAVK